jgi:hypothetical protein
MKYKYKTLAISAGLVLLLLSVVIQFSCQKGHDGRDKCANVTCAYGGTCLNGVCLCTPGYDGPSCETVSRSKFIHHWEAAEVGSISPMVLYPVDISPSGDSITKVVITGLYHDFFPSLDGFIVADSLIIPTQIYKSKRVIGRGYITDNSGSANSRIFFYYKVEDLTDNTIDDFGYIKGDNTYPSVWLVL